MNTRNWVILHHTASFATKEKHQFDAVDKYHKGKGWGRIAYHWFIEYDGTIKAGRPEDKGGAHCYQWMMNYRSVGICLAGQFDFDPAAKCPCGLPGGRKTIQTPSVAQIRALGDLLTDVQMRNGIRDGKIKLHRDFAGYKSCPGSAFSQALTDRIIFPRRMRWRILVEPRPDLNPTRE